MIVCILLGLGIILFIWVGNLTHASLLYRRAEALEKQYSQDPKGFIKLKKARKIYQQCYKLSERPIHRRAIDICQQKIDNCHRYQELLVIAKNYNQQGLFDRGLEELLKAQQLFITEELNTAIDLCQSGIIRQQEYEITIEEVRQLAREGNFQEATTLLRSALVSFDRQDGRELLIKLDRVIASKSLYAKGLIAEDKEDFQQAIALYKQALEITPELNKCKIRLAIIALDNNPQQAIDYLQDINNQRANYLRGYAYSQLKNWHQANKEWRSSTHPKVRQQRSILKSLIVRDRLTKIKEIEHLVENQELEPAIALSQELIQQYGTDLVVENNLENYLQPTLESQVWSGNNWEKITSKMEKVWLDRQDTKSLHNWATATYYQALINPKKITEFIAAWLTAIANLRTDPSLKHLPWLKENNIDFSDLELRLKQILENAIDGVKDNSLEQYFHLRDLYRRDFAMLSLREKDRGGIQNERQLLILPNCYQRLKERLPVRQLPEQLWAALYTDWGIAVAACISKDIARAIQIKPQQNPSSKIDRFAFKFVAYHEGLHYLQNQYWRKSIKPLTIARSQIKCNLDWYAEIDLLCQKQCKSIQSFEEHLEFSSFWYSLLESAAAANYYVEHQASKIGLEVDDGIINFQQGLSQLKDLEKIDPGNSFAADIIKTLEVNLQLEKINHLWQQNKYEEAVIFAKSSNHEKVRFAVAEVCLEIVLHILQNESITNESLNSMQTITHWAYELCPQEPSFQPVYSHLKRLGVYN